MTVIHNISQNIVIEDLSLFLKDEKILILSDLHIGQEEAINREGMLIPRFQYKDIINKTEKLLNKLKPRTVILNGDIKHEFQGISREENRKIQHYIDFISKRARLIVIKGNHDNILEPITKRKGIDLVDFFVAGDIFITHGDKVFDNEEFHKSKILIIGHEHCSIGLSEGNRVEYYKGFLKGYYQGKKGIKKEIIVMPSLNPLTEGTDVLKDKMHSPYLKNANIDNFEAWIVENEEVFYFGKLKGLRKL
jgi:uncharacterized protein